MHNNFLFNGVCMSVWSTTVVTIKLPNNVRKAIQIPFSLPVLLAWFYDDGIQMRADSYVVIILHIFRGFIAVDRTQSHNI